MVLLLSPPEVVFVKMKMTFDYMWSASDNEIIFCVKESVDWSGFMQNDISHTSLDVCFRYICFGS